MNKMLSMLKIMLSISTCYASDVSSQFISKQEFFFCASTGKQFAGLDLARLGINRRDIPDLISCLSNQPNLGTLNLTANIGISPAGLEELLQVLSRLPHLTTLNLKYVSTNTENMYANPSSRWVQSLRNVSPNLTDLNLELNSIDTEGIEILTSILPNTKITTLNLSGNCLDAEALRLLGDALPRLPLLTTLDLSSCGMPITGEFGSVFASKLKNSNIRTLKLGRNFLPAHSITPYLKGTKIKELDLRGISIDPKNAMQLAQDLRESEVEVLDLSFLHIQETFGKREQEVCEINTKFAIELIQFLLPGNTKLKNINLSHNFLNHTFARGLAFLLKQTQIRQLDLTSNAIGQEGAVAIARGLPRSHMTQLNLSNNAIGDGGTKDLAVILPATNIEMLSLERNDITSEGANSLAITFPFTKIKMLNLSFNKIGVQSMLAFDALKAQGRRVDFQYNPDLSKYEQIQRCNRRLFSRMPVSLSSQALSSSSVSPLPRMPHRTLSSLPHSISSPFQPFIRPGASSSTRPTPQPRMRQPNSFAHQGPTSVPAQTPLSAQALTALNQQFPPVYHAPSLGEDNISLFSSAAPSVVRDVVSQVLVSDTASHIGDQESMPDGFGGREEVAGACGKLLTDLDGQPHANLSVFSQ